MTPHTVLRYLALGSAAALLVTGCGGTEEEPTATATVVADTPSEGAASETIEATQATTEAAVETTEEYATENQVASVIAGYETYWREMIEEAVHCRFLYVMNEDLSPAEDMERYTCFLSEATIGTEAAIATREIEALNA